MISAELEGVVSWEPCRVFRTVKWSECDPGGVVHAYNVYNYALWAWDLLLLHWLGGERGEIWSPIKSVTLTHRGALPPGARLDMTVRPVAIGRTSFDVMVEGASADGRPIFDAVLRVVCADRAMTRAEPVPERLRARLRDSLAATTKA